MPVRTPEASPAPTLAPAPTLVPIAEFGRLRLLVSPASEVIVDGSSLGAVSAREVSLPPGRHIVRIQHADYQPIQRIVSIAAGIETALVIDLREKGIRVAH